MDGRLRSGDKITRVNSVSLLEMTHAQANQALMKAKESESHFMCLTVIRDPARAPRISFTDGVCVCVCVCGWVGGWVCGCVCVGVCACACVHMHACNKVSIHCIRILCVHHVLVSTPVSDPISANMNTETIELKKSRSGLGLTIVERE